MAICQKCGAEVADGSRFCMHCGAPLEQAAQQCVITTPSDPFVASSFISEGCSVDDSSAVEQAGHLQRPNRREAAPGEASASQQTKESPIPEAAAPEAAPASGPSYTGGTYVSPAVPPHPSYVSSHEAAEMLSPFALFGVLFAYLIPVVGQILAIIWAVGKTSNPFLRNLSRGYLLLVAVLIVFAGFTALSGFLTFLIFFH